MNSNSLQLIAYSSGTTQVLDSGLELAENIRYTTQYPGGLYASLSTWLPRDPTVPLTLKPGQRIVAYNGLNVVWEGKITSIGFALSSGRMGNDINALGYWSSILMARTWDKRWADTRVNDGVWVWTVTPSDNEELFELEREFDHIHILPKETLFASGDYASVRYTMPTGETIKRITYDYELEEDVQAWEILVWNVGTGAAVSGSSVTASASGSHDLTLATPSQSIELRLYSRGVQTADYNKHVHGMWSNIVVYSETGNINLYEIANDVQAHDSQISTDDSLIASNTLSIVPFISEHDTLADILVNAASYGDANGNSWAVGIRQSSITDNLPTLFVEQFPVLTDYDYSIRLDLQNLDKNFAAEQDITKVRNWIVIKYRDESGRTAVLTPDDESSLTDSVSVAAYGKWTEVLSVDTTSATTATAYGVRYLAAFKNPQWRVSSGITVREFVLGKNGGLVPASEIRAGKRIKVENWLNDLSGTGLTLLITGTDYNDDNRTNRIAVGKPTTLDVWLAQNIGG